MIWDCIGRRSSSFHFFFTFCCWSFQTAFKERAYEKKRHFKLLAAVRGALSFTSLECRSSFRRVRWGPWGPSPHRLTAASSYSSMQRVLCAQRASERPHRHSADPGKKQPDGRTHKKDTRNKKSWSAMHISIWMFLNGHDVHRTCFEEWIHLFREMKPACCKNSTCWCHLHL